MEYIVKRRLTLALTLAIALALPACSRPGSDDATVVSSRPEVIDAVERLADATRGAAQVRISPLTQVAKFVRTPSGSLDLPRDLTIEEKGTAFFERHGAVFGVDNASAELIVTDVRVGPSFGRVTFHQLHQGVEVFAGAVKAHFSVDGELVAVNGTVVPDLAVDTVPTWSAGSAAAVAVSRVARQQPGHALDAASSALYVFRSGLVRRIPGRDHLVYMVEVVNAARTVREFVFVDAHFGKVIDQITGVHDALTRDVSETSLGNVVWSEGDPDPISSGWSGGSAQQVADWQNEIDGAAESYNTIRSLTNGTYLSYDGADAQMRTVNNDPSISCPNANWNGTSANYCSGVTGDDTVAHEWGHAYTEYTNNLIYQWQAGALNESYSDIWGEIVDLINGRGADAPGGLRSAGGCSTFGNGNPSVDATYRWLSGEDDPAFNGAIRDLWSPTCYGDPGKVTDTQYHCATTDSGGVHTNSGVPNHAFALTVDGGTYNGATVNGIGLTKASRVYWEAQNLLTPASDFVDHADALDTACTTLIGAALYALDSNQGSSVLSPEVITASDCAQVIAASSAVEMRTNPSQCNFGPLLAPNAPAVCGGAATISVHRQDWEAGLGAWVPGTRAVANAASFDTPDWAAVTNLPDGRAGSAAFVNDDPRLGTCQPSDTEAGVLFLQSPVISIPADASSPGIRFEHWVATELLWDGGNVKISVNGGAFSIVPSGAYTFNAYNDTLNSAVPDGSDNPMAGEPAFTGTDGGAVSGSWGESQINLAGIASAGDDIQIRFEMGLDGCNGVVGWYVDTVDVYRCDPCGDGICGATEDCTSCPADCVLNAPTCGNGVCELGSGEDCQNCAADCGGKLSGKPSGRFCCGGDVDCQDSRCTSSGFQCTSGSGTGGTTCCGDGTCQSPETTNICAVDCPVGPVCGNGSCESGESCSSCASDCGTCPACGGNKASCSVNSDCCSNTCKNGSCKGN